VELKGFCRKSRPCLKNLVMRNHIRGGHREALRWTGCTEDESVRLSEGSRRASQQSEDLP
jgi:hypothetical protein